MADQLSTLFTPDFFESLVNAKLPFSMTEPLDFEDVGQKQWKGKAPIPSGLVERVWPVLEALSKLELASVPDLLQFLPPIADENFPRQALGLQLLLDQMTRSLLRGIDGRWRSAFFDIISVRYAHTLDALPEDQKPWAWSRWKTFATLDFWVLARTWYICPFVHSDKPSDAERALRFTEETRNIIEKETGTTDPHRSERDFILSDTYGVSRVLKEGPPGAGATVQLYAYWMCKLMDLHKPVIDQFGHYPYKNAYFGRENTPEEDAWFKKRDGNPMTSEELRSRLKRDIDAGIWAHLGAGRNV
ncbi:uncharacterized protein LY89DRAFT_687437 [Mollisia scopiformis]|uniref:Uncharacterized protein n=1 Tax=Mollisia scopiformis TaxID=149040 RepID=A0A194WZ84_MOLSC|nr:uncharacterized protein LY89DRAFT_687437 [Mollisia scopiformis]KUJ13260.1 hypothetical protein LY89DRAFT_687437 [Mollisia scopiformis]